MRIIADNASDILDDEAIEKGIDLVHLKIQFDDGDFVQRTLKDVDQFYDKLDNLTHIPKTSRPSPNDYLPYIEEAKANDEEVVILCLSSGLSGTYESAKLACELSGYQDKIEVVDTRHAILSERLLIDYAIQLRAEGKNKDEIKKAIEDIQDRTVVYGVIDTLKLLKLGGRIPGSLAFLGEKLQIKPIIKLSDGDLVELDKKRGLKAAKKKMIEELSRKELDPNFPIYFGYSKDKNNAQIFMDEVAESFEIDKENLFPIGGIIGTHVGPNGIGMAFVTKE